MSNSIDSVVTLVCIDGKWSISVPFDVCGFLPDLLRSFADDLEDDLVLRSFIGDFDSVSSSDVVSNDEVTKSGYINPDYKHDFSADYY